MSIDLPVFLGGKECTCVKSVQNMRVRVLSCDIFMGQFSKKKPEGPIICLPPDGAAGQKSAIISGLFQFKAVFRRSIPPKA